MLSRRNFLRCSLAAGAAIPFLPLLEGTEDPTLPEGYVPDPSLVLAPNGFSFDLGYPYDGAGQLVITQAMLEEIKQAGVRWVRVVAPIYPAQSWGEAMQNRLRNLIDWITGNGIQVGLLIDRSSWPFYWGSDDYHQAFVRQAGRPIVDAVGDKVMWIGLMNEPNLVDAVTYMDPSKYALLVNEWRQVIGTEVKLLSGSINLHPGNYNSGALTWLRVMLAYGRDELDWPKTGTPFDALAVQLYVDPVVKTTARRLYNHLAPIRQLIPQIPMWITEIGWASHDATVDANDQLAGLLRQADNTTAAIMLAKNYKTALKLKGVSFFCRNDFPSDPTAWFPDGIYSWGFQFMAGMVPDFMPEECGLWKPAMAKFQQNATGYNFT